MSLATYVTMITLKYTEQTRTEILLCAVAIIIGTYHFSRNKSPTALCMKITTDAKIFTKMSWDVAVSAPKGLWKVES